MSMYWLLLLIGAGLISIALWPKKEKRAQEYLSQYRFQTQANTTFSLQAINLTSLSDRNVQQRLLQRWENLKRQLGAYSQVKVLVFSVAVIVVAIVINRTMLRLAFYEVLPVALLLGWWFGYMWMQKRERKHFDEAFPDALNMLTSSISAGESIGRGIMYVGEKLEGEVGQEFKRMGERLKLGESLDDVFRKSCQRFPYPAFHFFVITLRANMQRGGQLKEVMSRLNRQMFEARAIERKKYALTSEARISAKIVCATPFFFLFMLQFLSPENYEFVMFHPEGRPLLYYLLISESVGMSIIWALMNKVK